MENKEATAESKRGRLLNLLPSAGWSMRWHSSSCWKTRNERWFGATKLNPRERQMGLPCFSSECEQDKEGRPLPRSVINNRQNDGLLIACLFSPPSFLPQLPPSCICNHTVDISGNSQRGSVKKPPSNHMSLFGKYKSVPSFLWTHVNTVEQIMCSGIPGGLCSNSSATIVNMTLDLAINTHWNTRHTL